MVLKGFCKGCGGSKGFAQGLNIRKKHTLSIEGFSRSEQSMNGIVALSSLLWVLFFP